MRWLHWIVLAGMFAYGRDAFAIEVVLVDQTSRVTVAMVDEPGDRSGDAVIVAWDNAPGDQPEGALVFRRERGSSETRYSAIGGGPLVVIDRGRHALVAGTSVPAFDVAFANDWDHPLRMIVAQDGKPDTAKLVARYRAYEHIGGDGEDKRGIDAAIRAQLDQTHKACGGSLAIEVAWAEFEHAGQLALAKQAVALLEAIASACSDRDYKAAISKLHALRVGYRAEGALDLAHAASDLAARVSPRCFNPREVARRWIKDNL